MRSWFRAHYVERSVFNTIQGAAIRSSGGLTEVIVEDNHFLGQ